MKRVSWPVVGLGVGALSLILLSSGSAGDVKPRCGIHGPIAPKDVRDAILDAWESRGYSRDEANRVVTHESGWHAGALSCNEDGGAVAGGMLQMISSVLRANGYNGGAAAFALLDARDQLPYCLSYIRKVRRSDGRPGNIAVLMFWPAALDEPDEFVIATKEKNKKVWKQNPGLRIGKDGPITAGSVRDTIRR